MNFKNDFFKFNIRPIVFWPPFALLILAVALSLIAPDLFLSSILGIQQAILVNFSLGFSWLSFGMTMLTLIVFVSPLGKYRIGGKDAKPRLSRISWFAIVLCTTVAVGILFWSSAEPISHFFYPPDFKNILPQSEAAKSFALGALFFHWGFTPYAIYAVPAMVFALLFYRGKQNYTLGVMLQPLFGRNPNQYAVAGLDMLNLFSMVSGMAAALGVGILSLSGGILAFYPQLNLTLLQAGITASILLTFIISSATGIEKGIKNLSLINLIFFGLIVVLFFILGTAGNVGRSLSEGLQMYFSNFLDLSTQASGSGEKWTYDWSTFNFAIWMAWAPITALFLGKIAIGRTVREFLFVNWFLPALFCLFWMSLFGGSTLELAAVNPELYKNLLDNSGAESIIYQVFKDEGYFKLFAQLYIVGIFISYVTAADSSTDAIASISMKGTNVNTFRSDTNIKILWGVLIGFLAWIMITFSGIDGVRILSVMGGLPAMFFLFLVCGSLILILISPKKYLD
jgi:choline-glycine betaine transporter